MPRSENDITIRGRIMYPHVHEPHAFSPDEEAFYQCVIVIADGDDQIAKIQTIVDRLCRDHLDGAVPAGDNILMKEGKVEGHVAISCKAKTTSRPKVLQLAPGLPPILDPSLPADGDWCYFSVWLFPYDTRGKKGVGAKLNKVAWSKAGDGPLGTAGITDDEAFGEALDAESGDNPF